MSPSYTHQNTPLVEHIIADGLRVVDCGCYGWRLAGHCHRVGAALTGVDQAEPPGKPGNAAFAKIDSGVIALPDEFADVVVASHVLEHVLSPVIFMQELVRITRQGGLIWIEAPSELSAMPPSSDDPEDHSFANFWDDPTHVRPWTPGAMYRLALSCHCMPVAVSRCDADGIPSTRMLARKPKAESQQPRYVGLRGVKPGFSNAWSHVWGKAQGEKRCEP